MTYSTKLMLPFAASAFLLSACVSMKAVPANTNFSGEAAFSVTSAKAWTQMPNGLNPTKGSALTQDGVPVGAVYLVTAKDDKAMIDKLGGGKNPPRFSAGSTALEQVDFLTDSLGQIGFGNLTTANVRPEQIDGQTGTRMELTGTYSNGLDMRGDAVLVESDAGLNILVYAAPEMHYYNKYKSDANAIIDSIDLK